MLVPLSVADCMTREVLTTRPETTVRAAARELSAADVGSLVVIEADEPVGIVTETDLVDVLADALDPDEVTVGTVMAADLITIHPDATLERAAALFEQHDVERFPVVDDGELVGIVAVSDLADYLPHLTERRRRVDAAFEFDPHPHLPADSPEMAYDHPDWEFAGEGTADGLDVGDVVRFRKRLTDEDVQSFAAASGDTNRLHLDGEFAAQTRFGERIVHGVLTTGVVSAALARLPGLVIYLSQDLRFMGPIGVGDVATAVGRVTEDMAGAKYRLDVAVYDEDGEAAVEGESVVLVDELPAGTDSAAVPVEEAAATDD
ncbi:CBS domain-containing protein [Haloarchaeobius salinus]|uniref:CBS domain-containing protein n=1 Tax=Haloarchaeobius salinus TaxID=1198298 RepID=UPI0021089BC4|nr:CBS domain-containing protein [Haloarchaeobius salinus]